MKPINVVVAIIENNNLYFIAKRNRNKHLGLQWEFPGGKVEKNETFKEALSREIYEELNVQINIQSKITMENYQDHKINIILHYYLCSIDEGEIKLSEHEDSVWLKKNEFYKYNMVLGDKKIIKFL